LQVGDKIPSPEKLSNENEQSMKQNTLGLNTNLIGQK
jgi:hypothetical protein